MDKNRPKRGHNLKNSILLSSIPIAVMKCVKFQIVDKFQMDNSTINPEKKQGHFQGLLLSFMKQTNHVCVVMVL